MENVDIVADPEFYVFLEDGSIETFGSPEAAARIAATHIKTPRKVGIGNNGAGKQYIKRQEDFLKELERSLY